MRQKRKVPRKLAAVLCSALAGIVACVFWGSRQERHERVGPVVGGYRCRFMLSTAWQSDDADLYSRDAETGAFRRMSDAVFKARPSPLLQWCYRSLLHRPPPPPAEIRLTTYTVADLPTFSFMHRFEGVYPEPLPGDQERIVAHRHLTIEGCPATFVRMERTIAGQKCPGTQVLIDVANHTVVYDLRSVSFSPADGVNEEIQAILSSFHVERVA